MNVASNLISENYNSNNKYNNTTNYEVNREKICPFLLKVFFKENEFNNLEDFNNNVFPPHRELHIYTWMDASLRELTLLIKEAVESAKKKDAVLYFSTIYPDSKGKLQRKEVGNVHSIKKATDDNKTLYQLKFCVGDYLDINISTNKSHKERDRDKEY
jgi:histone deacetylase complex subunit SAP18